MKINVKEFKELLKKSTINYYIDSVQLNYDKENDIIWSKMRSDYASSRINIKNNVFKGLNEEISLNFANPKVDIKPFVDLIDDEEVELKLNDDCLILNNQIKLHFDDQSLISVSNKDTIEKLDDYFVEFDINDDFINKFNKIKKIGNRFEKIYFVIKDNNLYIETTDKKNAYSNGIKFELCYVDYNDLDLCFAYDSFVSLMSTINDNYTSFTFSLIYLNDKGVGVIRIKSNDEQYYLVSKLDEY